MTVRSADEICTAVDTVIQRRSGILFIIQLRLLFVVRPAMCAGWLPASGLSLKRTAACCVLAVIVKTLPFMFCSLFLCMLM